MDANDDDNWRAKETKISYHNSQQEPHLVHDEWMESLDKGFESKV